MPLLMNGCTSDRLTAAFFKSALVCRNLVLLRRNDPERTGPQRSGVSKRTKRKEHQMESKWKMEEFASQPYRVFTGVVLQRSREVGMTIYKHLDK